eukprot:scaffold192393_cov18-Tisochrysis_lutea.AAC.4
MGCVARAARLAEAAEQLPRTQGGRSSGDLSMSMQKHCNNVATQSMLTNAGWESSGCMGGSLFSNPRT